MRSHFTKCSCTSTLTVLPSIGVIVIGSKHGAVKITKNKSVLTVCIYRHQAHCPETEFRKMRAAAALSPTGLRHSTALEPPNV